ncbi:MAG: RsmD family RNA methyltransferase [Candidatus Wallbacteria bacterium]|nr:RsmD family RNA methyltransferase [Candidatus Wallbacteria bacterium]
MKIVWGKYKGKVLKLSNPQGVRPLTGQVKMGIFNVLFNFMRFQDKVVADVFCGSGSFGIEALSLGAAKVSFIDLNPGNFRNNCDFLAGGYEVFQGEALPVMKRLADELYDLIFLDPPFKFKINSEYFSESIRILKDQGILAVRFCRGNQLEAGEGLTMFQEKKYGDSIVRFYRKGI